MSYLFKAGMLITFDPPLVERADLRIEGGRVVGRAAQLEAREGEEILDLRGRIVMAGMVCAHTHLYSALARGMPAPSRVPANFREILELIWWRLDRELDEETIYWSALVGALDAARAGTTCLFDHHSSPSHIAGSLQIVREAIGKVGLRGVLCYEVTDRGDRQQRDQGLHENRAFLDWVGHEPGAGQTHRDQETSADRQHATLFRGMAGAHASFTLMDGSLEALSELMRQYGVGLHIHVAEDRCDVESTHRDYGLGIVERLARHGALNAQTILAHGIHLEDHEIEIARDDGVWFAHNPRSNMNNRVGYAPVTKFGERLVLGTDGIGADMFEEACFGFFKARDGHSELGADRWLRVLAANQRMASEAFGIELGTLGPGSAADLIVLDYQSPTPLTAENLAWHLVFGLNSASVESVMVGGKFVIKDRRSALDVQDVYGRARKAAQKLWARLRTI